MRGWPLGLCMLVAALLAVGAAAGGASGDAQTYVVLYKQQSVGSDAAATIQRAGGKLVYAYDQIGVAIARSDSDSFRSKLLENSAIENAAATTNFATQLPSDTADASGPPPGDLPTAPATDGDTLTPLQWDMRQIHAPQAHAVTGGSPAVLV